MSKTQRAEKSDKIDNIVGMLMEYEKMTIDLMRKATDTPVLDQYDLNAPYDKARIVKEEGQTKYQIAEVQLADDERKKLKEIGELLIEELDVDIKKLGTNENAAAYIRNLVERIMKNYTSSYSNSATCPAERYRSRSQSSTRPSRTVAEFR